MEQQPIELDSETAELTVGNTDAVRFLDAAGLDAVGVLGQIGIALSLMPCDGVLSVHSDDPAARNAVASWCRSTRLPLLSEIRHDERSTTFVISRTPGQVTG